MSETDRPGPRVTADILRDIGLFGGLDDETLTILARELPTTHVEVGESVVEEGDLSREMFVVIGGELEVVKKGPRGGEFRVALFGPGDWFGEMSILDVQPRSATVRAVAPTMLVRISNEHVEKLLYRRDLKAYALLLMNIARELSRRLRVADGILGQFVSTVGDTYASKS
ncbi:MAG TPA: cyclic nucleotide-binding domain-containing protein [Polyangiaceae bacterium LLY-WYZ-15_(1-7)]|nr:protein kinase [Sandaracinus sp.]HJK91617.1 cyclic nucleotide-binding domain-containing protein [Polyangiaceae bacterium LLY-WYZ-15_(1-7)]HJL05404.1 cyclic nucleotide-binding domain-containing protein [Polyangiaceae bacterium LLY-WYZ-15_(1-7)]HJL12860.1 cyclic nucleotide-binding domain-containing protein [Polyangiaceae bacterium LLY-WYZ-15_(1-7)]HJL28210.1 cyclic nucleotide-binding domain-containing protein [Polyangiaceae bacterium LLY-WYZ-15_(1-7)]